MKTEERAERMERCAEKHAGHIILFDGKDIPWSDDWAPFTIILPFLAGRQPGSRFIQWAAKANMLTVVAKCTRLTLSASIDATSKDVFTSFCERAVPPSAFPVLPLTSAESADLMRDLFHMLDDSATGSSNAHSALHTDDDISDGDPSRWALRPPMPATASAAAASSKHDSADVFSALIRGGHRHHNRHHQRAKHEQTIKRQSDHSKSQTQEMTHPTKKQAIAGTEDIIWC